ncbi:MAG: hypothetical protein RIS09_1223 [Actinomycetota bacterium]|jgi:zinc transporter ZupT
MVEVPQGPTADLPKKRNVGCTIFIVGLIFGFWPLVFGIIGVYLFCGGNGNESTCGPAAAGWALLVTAPIGLIIMLVGVITALIVSNQRASKSGENGLNP